MKDLEQVSVAVADLQRLVIDQRNQMEESAKQAERNLDKVYLDVVSVLDAYDKALATITEKHWDASEDAQKCLGRFRNVAKRINTILSNNGVERIVLADGVSKDELCTVIDTEPDATRETGAIISVEKEGYIRNGRLLRRAEVVVVKN